MPGSVSEVQSPPESDEGMMQANGQKKEEGEHDYFFNMNGTPLGENSASRGSGAVSGGLGGL